MMRRRRRGGGGGGFKAPRLAGAAPASAAPAPGAAAQAAPPGPADAKAPQKAPAKKAPQLLPQRRPVKLPQRSGCEGDSSGGGEVAQRQAFAVLHTKRSNKKRKVFDDGVLVFEKGKAQLFDMDGKALGKTSYRLKPGEVIPEGATFSLCNKDIEVCAPVPIADLDSGKLFLAAMTVASAGAAPSALVSTPFRSVAPSASGDRAALPSSARSSRASPAAPLHDEAREGALVVFRGRPAAGKLPASVSTVVDPVLSKRLRPHQRAGVQFMFDCITGAGADAAQYVPGVAQRGLVHRGPRGCILADEMGLGKTLQAIALIWTVLRQGPFGSSSPWCYKAVVVTLSSLVTNWQQEFAKWLGRERVQPVVASGQGAKAAVEEFARQRVRRVLIISYEMFRKHAAIINKVQRVDLVVCDEGHRLKSAAGNQTVDALKGCGTPRRVLLTGTPVQNQLSEFYAMVDFVNPGALGHDVRAFQRLFQDPIERGQDKLADEEERDLAGKRAEELQTRTSGFILRRTAEINERFLPPRTDVNVFVQLGADQVARYQDRVRATFRAQGAGVEALQLIHHLRQLCTHASLLSDEAAAAAPLTEADLSYQVSGKLCLLDAFLRELRLADARDRVVLVSNSTRSLDLLEALCKLRAYHYLRLDGSTTSSTRQGLVNRFNDPYHGDSSSFAFLLSARAGGCGLNLIGANRLVLLDPDWNPATDQQVAARVWRDGQTKPVFVYRLLSTGTIEERIFQRQNMKLHSARGIVANSSGGPGAKAAKSRPTQGQSNLARFSKAELKQLFEFKAGTRCDTYDLLTSHQVEAEEDEEVEEGRNAGVQWPEYAGPADIPDPVMRSAVEALAASDTQVVTWVHAQRRSARVVEAEDGDGDGDGEQEEAATTSKRAVSACGDGDGSNSSSEDELELELALSAPRKRVKTIESSDEEEEE